MRSLNHTSTASRLMFAHPLVYHHHRPYHCHSPPSTRIHPATSPSPLLRDVGLTMDSPASVEPTQLNPAVRDAVAHSRLVEELSVEELGTEKHMGGPKQWEAQAVCHENGQRQISLPVLLSLLPQPSTDTVYTHTAPTACAVTTRTQDHLPRIKTRVVYGSFGCFSATARSSTSLASKREPEVVLFGVFTPLPPPPPLPHSKANWRLFF